MNKYPRLPAAIILLASMLAGGAFAYQNARRAGANQGTTLAELEVAIGRGDADAATWFLFGDRLEDAGRFADAATAYRRVMDLEPSNRDARLRRALAVAKTGSADAFYDCMREMVIHDPKMAVEIFKGPDAGRYLSQPRFQAAQTDAIAQAID